MVLEVCNRTPKNLFYKKIVLYCSHCIDTEYNMPNVKHERCFIAEDVYFVRAKFQGSHCVVQVSSGDYSQDMSIIVKSNHIEKDRRHTHGAAGGTNNSCRIANINLYSDTLQTSLQENELFTTELMSASSHQVLYQSRRPNQVTQGGIQGQRGYLAHTSK